MTNSAANPAAPIILVVEDEPLIRALMTEELRTMGCTVLEAVNADEALAIVRSGMPIDLIFTDMQMPGRLDGNGLIQRIRMERPSLKAVMVSGQRPETTIVPLLDGYLTKPFQPSQLGACVDSLTRPGDQTRLQSSPPATAAHAEEVGTAST